MIFLNDLRPLSRPIAPFECPRIVSKRPCHDLNPNCRQTGSYPETGFEEVGRIGGSLRACRGLRLDRGLYGNTRHRPRIMAFYKNARLIIGLFGVAAT